MKTLQTADSKFYLIPIDEGYENFRIEHGEIVSDNLPDCNNKRKDWHNVQNPDGNNWSTVDVLGTTDDTSLLWEIGDGKLNVTQIMNFLHNYKRGLLLKAR
jgi:hypothetical protein